MARLSKYAAPNNNSSSALYTSFAPVCKHLSLNRRMEGKPKRIYSSKKNTVVDPNFFYADPFMKLQFRI